MEGKPLHLLAQPHPLLNLLPNHLTIHVPASRPPRRLHSRKPKRLAAALSRRPPGCHAGAPSGRSWEWAPKAAAALVLQLSVFSVVFFFPSRARAHGLPPPAADTAATAAAVEEVAEEGDEEWEAALQKWKGKTYALSVPLRVVALRGSYPATWVKDFVEAQGKRIKFSAEFRPSLEGLFSEMSQILDKGQDSVRSLYQIHLCRNQNGDANPDGSVWGAPYRWGTLVIAYKKDKFKRHNLKPIQDWEDLWRPELAGKISMVDSPREVIGAVLKHLGSSYNTTDMDAEVSGGKEAVLKSFTQLQKQVQLFDSMNYLKSFSVGDAWVAVGWSSDVILAAKRMSNVAVVVPKSGSSLWADLWVIPCATKFQTAKIGGRIRGPSPLIHQWFDFCLQSARSLPFRQEVIPGASPLFLENPVPDVPSRPKQEEAEAGHKPCQGSSSA
ncbi:hypothetical protein PR202_ga19149 [Eleusine coracana subsp. coracana]|uniref:Spermidine-binding periplasmic protein SpuE n=1 Tax=Eleusine coracana subsp. coracana TaxID=191504 RepID=A0AAV5CUU9_ELECO|nr:hypothetical protein PR202_ga19149 [Eleusine coracana subsp. coracana]